MYLLDSTTDLEEHQRMFNLNDLEFFYCQFTLFITFLKILNWEILTFTQVRFVDSILSNNSTDDHCREFVRLGGLEPLINILGLPNLPLDFVSSQACQSVSGVCKSILVSICIVDVVVQIFPWLKIFQTSLIFTFLCLKSITIIRDKEKQKLNSFEKF